ncbi:MAG: AraC family transcriptional regulator [Spirochaetaceae bacterium]|nr:AraC family transcriptional regulator [Spirochaetaceae bacterium]
MSISKCNIEIGINHQELNHHGNSFFPIAIYKDDLQRDCVPWHWHGEIEIIVITKGKLKIKSGTNTFIINKGDGIFINSEVLHSVYSKEGESGELFSIVFHPRLVGGNSDSIYFSKYLAPIIKDQSLNNILLNASIDWQKEIIDYVIDAHKLCSLENNGYEFKVRDDISNIILTIFNNKSSKKTITSQKAIRDSKRSKNMLNYICNHYVENISVEQIASSSNISESEALRCFKNTIGTTPMQYVINYRLQKASELLIYSSLKIIEISLDCGFGEASYFSKRFKEKYKVTPENFRENYKADNL